MWQSVPDADPARGSYVKAFMDGTLGSSTALLIGGGGMRLMGPEGLAAVIRDAAAAGMPVAVHAIGDLANREALDAFEATEDAVAAARAAPPRRARPVRARRRRRALRPPRVTASVQYTHATSDRELAARLWADRLDHAYPYRQLLDAGVRLAGGSDAPVEELDPLAGLRAAAECGVSFDEALTSFTAAPAWLEGAEDRRGRSHPASTPTSSCSTATACARRWSPGAGSTVSPRSPLERRRHPLRARADALAQRPHVGRQLGLLRRLARGRDGDELRAHRVELDEDPLHLREEALELLLHPLQRRQLRASSASTSSALAGSPSA